MTFQAYKARIERAPSTKDGMRELSDIARQVEADRKLNRKDKIVLLAAVQTATLALARAI